MYCSKCGKENEVDALYCYNCGIMLKKKEEKKVLNICPRCGDNITTMNLKCKSCGYVAIKRKKTSAIEKLCSEIDELESKRKDKTVLGTIKDKIIGNSLSVIEKRIISLIINFPIPSDKEELFDLIFLAYENMNIDYKLGEDERDNLYYTNLKEAWNTKFNQAYKKAKTLYGDDSEFNEIVSLQEEKERKNLESIKASTTVFWLLGIVMVVLFSIITVMSIIEGGNCNGKKSDPNAIKIGYSYSELAGKNYEEVRILLENRGFTNIQMYDLNDLVTGWINSDGSVESVSIDGNDTFSKNAYFYKDDLIIITYHSFPN